MILLTDLTDSAKCKISAYNSCLVILLALEILSQVIINKPEPIIGPRINQDMVILIFMHQSHLWLSSNYIIPALSKCADVILMQSDDMKFFQGSNIEPIINSSLLTPPDIILVDKMG